MRKLLLLPLFLLIAACGSATAPVDTTPEGSGGDEAATPQESEQETPQSGETSQVGKESVATGTTPQEASVVRDQDYVMGASDPAVTIIEYGDFQ